MLTQMMNYNIVSGLGIYKVGGRLTGSTLMVDNVAWWIITTAMQRT